MHVKIVDVIFFCVYNHENYYAYIVYGWLAGYVCYKFFFLFVYINSHFALVLKAMYFACVCKHMNASSSTSRLKSTKYT